MKMKKGIFIMSLNSKRLKDAINNKNNFHFNNEVDELDVFVFDTWEILDGIFLNKSNAEQQNNIIERIIGKIETDFIAVDITKRDLLRYSRTRKKLNPYICAVYQEYYTNPVFESHCKNQVFQNLQPKLRVMSIESNKSYLIELLIPFLITEIALFLSIYHKNEYYKIYGMETEMNIVVAIRENKYPVFNPFMKANIDYVKIITN